MSDANPFTTALGEFRATYSVTQREIAKSMGITDGNISKIERGLVVPTMNFVDKMFDALNLEKAGYWYDKLHVALLQSRGKIVIDLENYTEDQIRLILTLTGRVSTYNSIQCKFVGERLPE